MKEFAHISQESKQGPSTGSVALCATFSFLRNLARAFHASQIGCNLYGSRRSAIELSGGVADTSRHEKVDYSCFGALDRGDGAGFLRERRRR